MQKGKTGKSLTFKRKIQLIDEVEQFPAKKKSVIAEEFKLHPSTVTAVLKNKEKYPADFQYLDSASLKGESELDADLPTIYAMCSEHYSGQKLSEQAVRSILEAEVEQCAKPASYMDIWQLHALSNILNCKLMSVYPQRGGATVRRHLQRWITLFPKPSPFQWSQMAIMWTSTQGKEWEAKDLRVYHFFCVRATHGIISEQIVVLSRIHES